MADIHEHCVRKEVLSSGNDGKLWFVGRTRYGQELKVRELLRKHSVESFIPSSIRYVLRCGKRRRTESALVHGFVFLRCTKAVALEMANVYCMPARFMIDSMTGTLMVVSERDMASFMRLFDNEYPVEVDKDFSLAPGDAVRVVSGPLAGIEGRVLTSGLKTYIALSVGSALMVRTEISKNQLEKI